MGGRAALVLDGAYFTQLLGDDIVAKSFMMPIAHPGVVEAQIRRLAGFDIFETTILPENGEKLVGFAAHPSGPFSPALPTPAIPVRHLGGRQALPRTRRRIRRGWCGHRPGDGPHVRLPALR